MKYTDWEVTPEEYKVIKFLLKSGVEKGIIVKSVERSYFTVHNIDVSRSFRDFRKIIKEFGINRARNLVARLDLVHKNASIKERPKEDGGKLIRRITRWATRNVKSGEDLKRLYEFLDLLKSK